MAPFRDAAQGAYSIIHDDTCDTTVDSQINLAEPELNKRGLVAAFGAIVKMCVERDLWNTLAGFVEHGHEIINHSWSHPDFAPTDGVTPAPDLAIEMDQATTVLDENLPVPLRGSLARPPSSFFRTTPSTPPP